MSRRHLPARSLPFVLAWLLGAPAAWGVSGTDGPEAIGPYLNGIFPSSAPSSSGEWAVEEIYQGIQINLPMQLTPYPGSDRLLCVAKEGRIFTFQDDPAATSTALFLDLSAQTFTSSDSGLTWLVFHPEFGQGGSPNRGHVYVTYKWAPSSGGNGSEAYWRLSRFTVPDGTIAADPASEQILIQQYDRQQWHDSGCMMFGPDGYLYVAVGDEGGANDAYDDGQKLDERLFSGILRIDVDQGPGSHPIRRQPQQLPMPPGWPDSFTANYSIPDDNPFVDPGGGWLEEFYAIGLRQPYRFSHDPVSGRTWIGESGQDTEEELDLLEPGANYGWPFREGVVTGPKAPPATVHGSLTEPVWSVNHANGPDGCMVGGFVYRGSEHPPLVGRFLAVDNVSGRIRAFDFDGSAATGEILTSMPSGSVYSGTSTIGRDHAGEPVFVKINGTGSRGAFYRLTVSEPPVAQPLWFRFEDQQGGSGYVADNPGHATGDAIADGTPLLAYDTGAVSSNVVFAASNGLLPAGEGSNGAGIHLEFGDGDGYPGNDDGDLYLAGEYGRLDDFTIELSFRPGAGSLSGGYRCYYGLDGTTGSAPTDGEYGPPLQPFRLMRWGRDDAGATSIPLEDGDLFLNVRTLDPSTDTWTSVPLEVLDDSEFLEGEWYHLAIVGDAAAGTVTVWRFDGSTYQPLGQAAGYVGNLQPGIWSVGRGAYGGNPADWVGRADFDEVRMVPEALDPAEFLYAASPWEPRFATTDPPPLLSQTGAFDELASLSPAQGVFPYTVNAPLWSDAARKRRWIALPNDGLHDTPEEQIGFHPDHGWEFPAGTVMIKHFELPVDETDPSRVRRLETRFLVFTAAGEPYGVTYRWRPDGSDAELLADGASDPVTIEEADGGSRVQPWDYPSRSDCMICHNRNAGHSLGVNTHQLNGDLVYPRTGRTANQLETLAAMGWFDGGYRPEHLPWFLKSHGLDESGVDPGTRVRSYLDSNCAQCHRPGGVRARFDARFTTPLAEQGLIRGALEANYFTPEDRVVVPGDVASSILHTRMAALDSLQMPPLAKHLVDPDGLAVLEEWILALPEAPVVELAAPPSATGEFEVAVAFSESVSGLSAGDFRIHGGTAAALSGSGASYSLTVVPSGPGVVDLSLPEGSAEDPDGQGNFASARVVVPVAEGGLGTWLKLDDGAGTTAFDSASGGNPGTLLGMESGDWIEGRFGGALRFDTSDERLTLANLATGDFTVSFWMRTTQLFPQTGIVAQGSRIFSADIGGAANDWVIGGTRSAAGVHRISFHTGHADGSPNAFVYGATAVNTGEWVHVAATRDRSTGEMALYVNGVLDATAAGSSDLLDANPQLSIGGSPSGAAESYAGDLDQIRIHERVLAPAEIVALMNETGDAPDFGDWLALRLPGLGHLHAPELDIEGDGRSNFGEYAFGGDPLVADRSPMRVSPRAGGGVEVRYTRRKAPSSVAYRLFVGGDLQGWVDGEGGVLSSLGESIPDPGYEDYERVTLEYLPAGDPERLFLRVEAEGR